MKIAAIVVGITAMAGLVACSEKPPESVKAAPAVAAPEPVVQSAPPPQVVDNASLMSRVFRPEMIGSTISGLEKLTGAAVRRSPDGTERTYTVTGCSVTAITSAGPSEKTITALRVVLTQKCQVDIASLIGEGRGSQSENGTMTFGKFDKIVGGAEFYADCLGSNCGNAFDPTVYLHWTGPRASDFLEIMAQVKLVENKPLDAATKWLMAMESRESPEWMMENNFNCHPEKYHSVALAAFKHVVPEAITIGRGLSIPQCRH